MSPSEINTILTLNKTNLAMFCHFLTLTIFDLRDTIYTGKGRQAYAL